MPDPLVGAIALPDGTAVRGRGRREGVLPGPFPDSGLHLGHDPDLPRRFAPGRWPDRPAEWIEWPDFRTPADDAAAAFRLALARAAAGERVEVACGGGTGRTGTVIARLAVLAGQALVRSWKHYRPRAVDRRSAPVDRLVRRAPPRVVSRGERTEPRDRRGWERSAIVQPSGSPPPADRPVPGSRRREPARSREAPVSTTPSIIPVTSTLVARLRAAGCVFAEDEADLLVAAAGSTTELDDMVRRRAAGLPLEQVLGWAEFCGRRIAVEPGVFVPRRRTEFLARRAAAVARRHAPPVVVLDMCCGTGALAAVLAAEVDGVEPFATDVDPVAVACARRNLPPERVFRGDLFAALPPVLRGRVAVLVANAPYVPTGELGFLPAEARLHEAEVALDGGSDGLEVQRRVIAEAPAWLAVGGSLLIETSARQAPGTAAAMASAGLATRTDVDDELDATVVTGTLAR